MPLANATQYDNDAFGNPPGTENLNRTNDIVSCSSEATSHTILETPFTSAHFPPGNPSNVGYLHSPNPYPGPGYSGYVYPQGGWASTWPVSAVYGQSQLPIMPSTPVHPSPYSAGPQLASLEARTSALQPPSFRKNWDTVITGFFKKAGLSQALRGFEADMIVMNSEWESTTIPIALECLRKDLMQLYEGGKDLKLDFEGNTQDRSTINDRKLDYVHPAANSAPTSQESITKSISKFLANNRARNNVSNRHEFLLTLAEKRRKLSEDRELKCTDSSDVPSCARTDAKTQNRDIQMRYDIAKNEDGPLRKTMKGREEAGVKGDIDRSTTLEHGLTAEQYPALDERLRNIEAHLSVRYVPSFPLSLLDRLRFLEDHIIHLEKEYPPWAALHFNQPRRGWPPPPRPTPIIVPSHLTSTSIPVNIPPFHPHSTVSSASGTTDIGESSTSNPKTKPARNTKSSLHRAVMERLEVQKAMHDLASRDITMGQS